MTDQYFPYLTIIVGSFLSALWCIMTIGVIPINLLMGAVGDILIAGVWGCYLYLFRAEFFNSNVQSGEKEETK
jgi:hypothetical protein